jgi:hypothetical protein
LVLVRIEVTLSVNGAIRLIGGESVDVQEWVLLGTCDISEIEERSPSTIARCSKRLTRVVVCGVEGGGLISEKHRYRHSSRIARSR